MRQLLGKNGGVVDASITVTVFQHTDPAFVRFPLGWIVGVVPHLGHPSAPLLVEHQFHRIGDVGLGGEDFNPKVFADLEGLEGLFCRQRKRTLIG